MSQIQHALEELQEKLHQAAWELHREDINADGEGYEFSITLRVEKDPDQEPDEPSPEDYYITPSGYLGSQTALGQIEGRHVGIFPTNEEAIAHAKAKMDEEEFWPDIWHLSDHGNWLLLNASDYGEESD